jgi:hypothetical protein
MAQRRQLCPRCQFTFVQITDLFLLCDVDIVCSEMLDNGLARRRHISAPQIYVYPVQHTREG